MIVRLRSATNGKKKYRDEQTGERVLIAHLLFFLNLGQ
tara:strand:- start:438 stop:551 length:114 start_codon:yes stop_codon:yes gene_type:complete